MQNEREMIAKMNSILEAIVDKKQKFENYAFSNVFVEKLMQISILNQDIQNNYQQITIRKSALFNE